MAYNRDVISSKIQVAAAQMLVEGGAPERNLDRAARMIEEAASQGCHLVVFPECSDLGWTDPSVHRMAEPIPGPRFERLCEIAEQAGIFVAMGLTERAGTRLYNSAVLLDDRGKLLLKHRKINVMDIAQDLYSIGDRLGVRETSIGTMGLTICADNFPNALDLGRSIGRMGAHLLLSPSAWAVEAEHDPAAQPYGSLWRQAYSRLAPEFQMAIVAVSNVGPIRGGPWAGRRCIGCSLIFDPQGREIAAGPYGEEALLIEEVELVTRGRPRGTSISGTY